MMKLLHDFILDARTAEDVALTQEMVNDTKSCDPLNPFSHLFLENGYPIYVFKLAN